MSNKGAVSLNYQAGNKDNEWLLKGGDLMRLWHWEPSHLGERM